MPITKTEPVEDATVPPPRNSRRVGEALERDEAERLVRTLSPGAMQASYEHPDRWDVYELGVTDEARTFRLVATGARPLTVNAVAGMHRQQWARHTRLVREQWGWLARAEKVPHLERARFVATPLHANGRSPQDAAACAPEVKAAIDGLVDAGVLPDDDGVHVASIEFLPPRIAGVDGLELVVEEVA